VVNFKGLQMMNKLTGFTKFYGQARSIGNQLLRKGRSPGSEAMLGTIARRSYLAYVELLAMDVGERNLLLHWLNGYTSAPTGYGIADYECRKEDAYASRLRNWHKVAFTSERMANGRHRHFMTAKQVEGFLCRRGEMRRLVDIQIREAQWQRSKRDVARAIQRFGTDGVMRMLCGDDSRRAANDD
jgi:hypothetical protein